MKRFLIPAVVVFAVLSTLGLGTFFWWRQNSKPMLGEVKKVRFVVPKGYSASQTANKLSQAGLIRNPLAFKVYVQVIGKTHDIKPGEFNLSNDMKLVDIVNRLLKGPDELWVTIPEGLRKEEIVERYIETLEMGSEAGGVFRQEFLRVSEGKEGFLFPDTYLFPRDVSASIVIKKMTQTFDEKVDASMRKGIDESGYSLNDVITMASIIERETREDEERPIVSGILWKRLKTKGWLMQADATNQYALATLNCKGKISCNWWPTLTKEDLEIDSPFNSYVHKSLPPNPIANPGLSSIKAGVFPQESDFWFYLHDPQGKIHYAKTIQEHNQNIKNYLER